MGEWYEVPDPLASRRWTVVLGARLAIKFADDQINQPELGIMEWLMPRVKRAKYVLVPAGEATVGHGTHTKAEVWKKHLSEFLQRLPD